MSQKMLSIKQVSELMGMGIHQAERLVKSSGSLPLKFGRRYFIPENKFARWI